MALEQGKRIIKAQAQYTRKSGLESAGRGTVKVLVHKKWPIRGLKHEQLATIESVHEKISIIEPVHEQGSYYIVKYMKKWDHEWAGT